MIRVNKSMNIRAVRIIRMIRVNKSIRAVRIIRMIRVDKNIRVVRIIRNTRVIRVARVIRVIRVIRVSSYTLHEDGWLARNFLFLHCHFGSLLLQIR